MRESHSLAVAAIALMSIKATDVMLASLDKASSLWHHGAGLWR
jgi:hypothetical protein